MFAFIILDSVSKMETSAIMPILFGLIGATLAWIWGSQNERGISYPTIAIGAVLGAAAGAFLVSQTGNQGGLATAHGRLSDRDLLEMKQKRDMANQFVVSAFRERKDEVHPMMANYYLSQYQFGDTSSRSVVTRMLLEKEADSLGIQISDEFITNYIKTVSDNGMTREALTKIRSQLGLGESELYDTLRAELRARVASRVLNPSLVHMPDQYWGDFEKLNVRHSIDAVAVPVEPFAARLPKPSDTEINEVFEAFKGVYPMGENPGFIQPDRLKLAWFESDYEAAEALVGEIPEDELKVRYEERKETEYKIETLPDFGSSFDDGAPKFGEPPAPVKTTTPETEGDTPEGDAPAEAAKSDESKAAPAAKAGDDAPAKPPASDDVSPTKDAPVKDAPSTDEKSDGAAATKPEAEECGDIAEQDQEADAATDEATAKKDKAAETPATDPKPVDETKPAADPKPVTAETPAADPKPVDETKPAADPKPVTAETPAADPKPVDETKPAAVDAPADPDDAPKDATEAAAPAELAEVKYRSFEELRDEIRDLMLREKTEERIAKQVSAAITAVKDWRFKLREEKPEISDEDLAAGIAARAKIYAKENGLKFVVPAEFLSQQELIEHKEYRLGTAREPSDPADFMAQPQSAAARLFTGATTLFIPEEAQGQFDDTRYAFWATGEKEQHVPTIDEPGVRKQVEKAVRIRQARTETEARATKLAESLKAKLDESSIISIAQGVADQSVFGTKAKAPATIEKSGDDSSDSAPAKADDEASNESEKEESCGDEESAEAAADETETQESAPAADSDEGTSDEVIDEPLSVISTPPFTWYRQSSQGMQMNPFAQPTIEFGFIPGIDGVDDNFMKVVSATAVGDVVVIPNLTKQVYYVVHVKARNPSGDSDPSLAPVRQQFITENVPMSQIYGRLAESSASETYQAWQAEFFAKHNVSVEELDAI
jgi:hypothetical protein